MKNLLIITGPTATGKSEICFNLAKNINGIIVNCDSKQIYKEIPIITAQPTFGYNEVTHKLYGYVSVKEHYSVGLWLEDLQGVLSEIHNQKNQAIITGGSGLYINALMNGISSIPQITDCTKERSRKILKDIGNEEFYKLLIKRDPSVKNKIHPNNFDKLLRAFEVLDQTNIPLSEWHKVNRKLFSHSKVDLLILLPPREEVYKRINERCIHMLNSGIIEEVETLLLADLPLSLPAMKSHGIPEITQYLQRQITLSEALEAFQKKTRNYAKRQYTWFRNQFSKAEFFDNSSDLINYVMTIYSNL